MSIDCRGKREVRLSPVRERVVVRVPASTSNLGPGFDCLGVALRLYNDITVSRLGALTKNAMAVEAATLFFRETGVASFPFACSVKGDVPQSRGLGSSVTVRLGVLLALNRLAGEPIKRDDLFQLCAKLEGHPDNAAPAAYGGFTVARANAVQRFEVNSRLKFVLLIPDFEVSTSRARSVLPKRIDRIEALSCVGNACAIAAAFASGVYENLAGSFSDFLHQPFRMELNPHLCDIIAAGESAGALGGFLSGSGSTVACVTLKNAKAVASAMQSAASSRNAAVLVSTADNGGARVLKTQ